MIFHDSIQHYVIDFIESRFGMAILHKSKKPDRHYSTAFRKNETKVINSD